MKSFMIGFFVIVAISAILMVVSLVLPLRVAVGLSLILQVFNMIILGNVEEPVRRESGREL